MSANENRLNIDRGLEDVRRHLKEGNLAAADELCGNTITSLTGSNSPSDRTHTAEALILWARIAIRQGAHGSAIDRLDEVVDRFQSDPWPEIQFQTCRARVLKGWLLGHIGRHTDSLTVLESVLRDCGGYDDIRVREQLADATLSVANSLLELKRPQEALEILRPLIDAHNVDQAVDLCSFAEASSLSALALNRLGHLEDAISAYTVLIDRLESENDPYFRQRTARALSDKAFVLYKAGRVEESLETEDRVIAEYGGDTETATRSAVARAMHDKAVILDRSHRVSEAIASYDDLIAVFAGHEEPRIQALVSRARLARSHLA